MTENELKHMMEYVQKITDSLNTLTRELAEVKTDLRHLLDSNRSFEDLKTRVITLEVKASSLEKFHEQQSATNKWLIGIVIGLIIALLGVSCTVGIAIWTHLSTAVQGH